jgi:tRNA(Ile)-lysidine synthase
LNQKRLRPLLGFSKKELAHYLRGEPLPWVEDPSNNCEEPLRNWLRQKWLPELEAKQQGAVFRLSQSMERLAEALKNLVEDEESALSVGPEGLELSHFLQLSRFRQKQTLAQYMNVLGMSAYKTTHIEEILKRLDKDSQRTQFYLLGHEWTLGPKYISASPRGG